MPSERLSHLNCESPHSTGRTDDEDSLPGGHPAHVAQRLECGDAGYGNGSGLIEGELRRLMDQVLLGDGGELGERTRGEPHDLVAWLESRHGSADGLHGARDVVPAHRDLRSTEAQHETGEIGPAGHVVPD